MPQKVFIGSSGLKVHVASFTGMTVTPAYEWEESEATVTVKISLRGFPRGNNDMLSTDVLLKVSASPFLLLLDLHGEVDSAETVATVSHENLAFVLQKRTHGLWGQLTALGSKDDLARRRKASLEPAYERLRAEDTALMVVRREAARQREDEKYEKLDNRMNANLAAQDAMMARTTKDVTDWKSTLRQHKDIAATGDQIPNAPPPAELDSVLTSDQSSDSDDEPRPADHSDYFGRGWQLSKAAPATQSASVPDAARNGSKRPSKWDQVGSGGSDSDDEGRGSQPIMQVSTKKRPSPPPPPPEWVSQIIRPPPRSGLASVEVGFTDMKLAPGVPARTRIPEEEPQAPLPEERKLSMFGGIDGDS